MHQPRRIDKLSISNLQENFKEVLIVRLEKVDINRICRDYGIRTCSYSDNPKLVKKIGLDSMETTGISFGASDGTPVILFDDRRPPLETRFTAAHELGHILLGHLDYRKSLKEAYPAFAESEANYFAVSILVYDLIRQYGNEGVQGEAKGQTNV